MTEIMNVEKYIKNEAKASLKGNWIKAVTSLFISVLVLLASMITVAAAFEVLGDYDTIREAAKAEPLRLVFFVLFHLLAVAGLILMSPVFAGSTKVISSIAKNKTADIGDVFYYFSSSDQYKECVKFMTRLIVSFVAVIILFEFPCIGGYILLSDVSYCDAVVAILGIIGFFGGFLFSLGNMFALFYYTEGAAVKESFDKGAAVSKGNVSKLVKLTFSFFGWIVSLFLIVPFIYVVPYMMCAYFVSVKYLKEQYEKEQTAVMMPMMSDAVLTGGNPEAKASFTNPNYTPAADSEPLDLEENDHSSDIGGISLDKGGAVEEDLL